MTTSFPLAGALERHTTTAAAAAAATPELGGALEQQLSSTTVCQGDVVLNEVQDGSKYVSVLDPVSVDDSDSEVTSEIIDVDQVLHFGNETPAMISKVVNAVVRYHVSVPNVFPRKSVLFCSTFVFY